MNTGPRLERVWPRLSTLSWTTEAWRWGPFAQGHLGTEKEQSPGPLPCAEDPGLCTPAPHSLPQPPCLHSHLEHLP